MRKTKSAILEAVHDTARGLYQAGAMDQPTLHEFDRLCRTRPSATRVSRQPEAQENQR
jgi:putative transcriptional regulator